MSPRCGCASEGTTGIGFYDDFFPGSDGSLCIKFITASDAAKVLPKLEALLEAALDEFNTEIVVGKPESRGFDKFSACFTSGPPE